MLLDFPTSSAYLSRLLYRAIHSLEKSELKLQDTPLSYEDGVTIASSTFSDAFVIIEPNRRETIHRQYPGVEG
jgi:hypothetical protein